MPPAQTKMIESAMFKGREPLGSEDLQRWILDGQAGLREPGVHGKETGRVQPSDHAALGGCEGEEGGDRRRDRLRLRPRLQDQVPHGRQDGDRRLHRFILVWSVQLSGHAEVEASQPDCGAFEAACVQTASRGARTGPGWSEHVT